MLRNPQSKVNRGLPGVAGSINNSDKPRWLVKQEQTAKSVSLISRTLAWINSLFGGWFSSNNKVEPILARKTQMQESAWKIKKRKRNRHLQSIAFESRRYNYIHA